MANIKGNHKCPICGMNTTFTITDLDYQICDECKEPVSIGKPVRDLRKKILNEQEATRLIEEGMGTFDEKGVLHSNSGNDFQDILFICQNLIVMLRETVAILEDNRLMVGENKAETEDYMVYAEDKIKGFLTKYKK